MSETGSEQRVGSVEAGKSSSQTLSVAGVNRRTAVLFGNKTPRRSLPRASTAHGTQSQSQSPGALLGAVVAEQNHLPYQQLPLISHASPCYKLQMRVHNRQ